MLVGVFVSILDAPNKELIHHDGAGSLVAWVVTHPELLVPGALVAFWRELRGV